MDKLFWIFIIFALISFIKNLIEQNAKQAKNQSKAQKRPQNNNGSNESAEEFFERVLQEKSQKKLKTKRSKKEVEFTDFETEVPTLTPSLSNFKEDKTTTKVEVVETSTRQKTQQRIKHNKINIYDKQSLRNAIILNEILTRPKAYKY